jgi:hypothetical protein
LAKYLKVPVGSVLRKTDMSRQKESDFFRAPSPSQLLLQYMTSPKIDDRIILDHEEIQISARNANIAKSGSAGTNLVSAAVPARFLALNLGEAS